MCASVYAIGFQYICTLGYWYYLKLEGLGMVSPGCSGSIGVCNAQGKQGKAGPEAWAVTSSSMPAAGRLPAPRHRSLGPGRGPAEMNVSCLGKWQHHVNVLFFGVRVSVCAYGRARGKRPPGGRNLLNRAITECDYERTIQEI